MGKRKKGKQGQQQSPVEVVKTGKEKLNRGQAREARELFRSVESKLKQSSSSSKKISIPPHIIALQAELPGLIARACYSLSQTETDLERQLGYLEEAINRAPDDFGYRLARGLLHLKKGNSRMAVSDFQKAEELQPGDPLASRSMALGQLVAGSALEARNILERVDAESHNLSWERLASMVGMFGGLEAQLPGIRRQFPLFDGLNALVRSDHQTAVKILSDIPLPDHNPSDADAALLATQLYYCGTINFAVGAYPSAFNNFSEVCRLAGAHNFNLPLIQTIPAYLREIAAKVSASDLTLSQKCWQLVLDISPDDAASKNNLSYVSRVIAQRAWQEGDLQTAVSLWRDALREDSQDERLHKNLAIAYDKLEKKSESLKSWRALARIWRQQFKSRSNEPGFKDRLVRLELHIVQLMIEADLPDYEIVNELESAIKIDPENLELRFQTAERLLELGHPQKALKHLEMVEREQGASSELLTQKGVALFQMKRNADAEKAFDMALGLDSSIALARRGLILILADKAKRADLKDDFKGAIGICLKQLKLDPTYRPAMIHLASLNFRVEQDDEAFEWLDRVTAAGPDNASTHLIIGEILIEFGHTEKAEKEFDRAIEIDPSFDTYHDIAMCCLDEDDIKTAVKYLKRAANIADANELLDLSRHMFECGREKDAGRFIEKAKKLDPTNPMPYIVQVTRIISDPFSLLRSFSKSDEINENLDTAEQLAMKDPMYDRELKIIRDLRQRFSRSGLEELASFFESN